MAEPKSISQARKMGKSYFIGKDGKRKAAVTKEELDKSGLSLRDYLNKQSGKTRRTTRSKVKSKPPKNTSSKFNKNEAARVLKTAEGIPEPKKYSDTGQRPDSRPVKSTSKSKSKTLEDILGTREKSRARRRARQEAKTKADTSMTPEQKLKGQIGISAATAALIAPVAIPILINIATKHGYAFAKSLGNKIKNLTSGQQKEVLQEVKETPTKTAAEKLLKDSMRVFTGRQPLKRDKVNKDKVEPTLGKSLTPEQRRTADLLNAAKQSQRKEIDTTLIGPLKRGGQIKKYNKGGKVVKRQEGGQVMSGNDFVSSLYD